jgi:acyl-CoA thioesterase-1
VRSIRLLIVASLALGAWASAAPAADRPAAARVLCFGDSITEGSALPRDERPFVWPALVEQASAGGLKLINEGKGGRPTASVDEFERALAKHAQGGGVDVVVIALGTNDSRDTSDVCVPKAVANVRKMVERARAKLGPAAKVLLVGPPNINKAALVATKPIADPRERKIKDLNAAFEALAKEAHCDYVGLFGAVPEQSMTRDGVHPDKAGNQAIAAVMGRAIGALVERK